MVKPHARFFYDSFKQKDKSKSIVLAPTPSSTINNKPDVEEVVDVMVQQLKYIACLKILMDELATLASGFEVEGGMLRYMSVYASMGSITCFVVLRRQLYYWLQKEAEILEKICDTDGQKGEREDSMIGCLWEGRLHCHVCAVQIGNR